MPIKIPDKLPAAKTLMGENIFVMTQKRAVSQDIRPLKIAIFNLMPTKITTETQLMRALSNSPLQVEVVLLHASSHQSKNTSQSHLESFYKTFDDVKNPVTRPPLGSYHLLCPGGSSLSSAQTSE